MAYNGYHVMEGNAYLTKKKILDNYIVEAKARGYNCMDQKELLLFITFL